MPSTATTTRPLTDDYFDLVKRFPLVPIRDAQHLKSAHEMIDQLSTVSEDSLTEGQSAYLAVLSELTTIYEAPAFDELTKGVGGMDVLRSLAEAHDLTAEEVGAIVGRPQDGGHILTGEKSITLQDAILLGRRFGLPSETFLA